jgi:hypothetical protein
VILVSCMDTLAHFRAVIVGTQCVPLDVRWITFPEEKMGRV